MVRAVCQSAIVPAGGVEPPAGLRFEDGRVMAACHRLPFTVTVSGHPGAGNLHGPTMSKSECRPIIAQVGRGRIRWAGREDNESHAGLGRTLFFGSLVKRDVYLWYASRGGLPFSGYLMCLSPASAEVRFSLGQVPEVPVPLHALCVQTISFLVIPDGLPDLFGP